MVDARDGGMEEDEEEKDEEDVSTSREEVGLGQAALRLGEDEPSTDADAGSVLDVAVAIFFREAMA